VRIDRETSPNAIMQELGRRIAAHRIAMNMTQATAAREAGVGKRTVERIEAGEDSQLSTLIRLFRVLGLADGLESLVPEQGPSPIDLLKLKKKQRRRASTRGKNGQRQGWQWGDEA